MNEMRPPTLSEAEVEAERRRQIQKIMQVVWYVTGVLEALIGVRVVLRLMAANPDAGFARFIYGITSVFLAPFMGLTPAPAFNGSVLELWALIGMLVYALLALGINKLIRILFLEP
jgi:ABC-type xylose transport system permease subunit